jgi:tRNA uridine 5-carboxymethylaminomethyl modification enzyme
MFTSRAEYRLMLREDNADWRLTEIGYQLGVVDEYRWKHFEEKREKTVQEIQRLKSTWAIPKNIPLETMNNVFGQPLEREYSLQELLRRPGVTYETLMTLPDVGPGISHEQAAEQVEIQTKYEGYIEKQKAEVAKQEHNETMRLPKDIDYAKVRGLSAEVQQKLNKHRPETIGQASRISGMTPAAISLLLVHLKRGFSDIEPAQTKIA